MDKQVEIETICSKISDQVKVMHNACFRFKEVDILCIEVGQCNSTSTSCAKIQHELSLVSHVLGNLKHSIASLCNSVGFQGPGLSGSSQISSGSNVPYIKVPVFDGNPVKQEFDSWKLRVNLFSKLTRMDAQTEALFIALKLQGPAFQLYNDLPEQDRMVSSKIFEVLDNNFKFQNRGFQRLQCISQCDQTIYEYYEKLLEYLVISNITNDVQRVYYFERGLGPQYKEKMLTQKFETLEKALAYALYLEATEEEKTDLQKEGIEVKRADINPSMTFPLVVVGVTHTVLPYNERIVRATLEGGGQEGREFGVVQQINIQGLRVKTKLTNNFKGSVRIKVVNPTGHPHCVGELQGRLVFHAINEEILLNHLPHSIL